MVSPTIRVLVTSTTERTVTGQHSLVRTADRGVQAIGIDEISIKKYLPHRGQRSGSAATIAPTQRAPVLFLAGSKDSKTDSLGCYGYKAN